MKSVANLHRSCLRLRIADSNVAAHFFQLESLSGKKLSLDQRILLGYSGSVQLILEALYGPVSFRISSQWERPKTILRHAEIVLSKNGKMLIRANSVIYKAAFDNSVFLDRIREKKLGIGSILLQNEMECFRRITEIGYDFQTMCPYRRYSILQHGAIAIRILELILPTEERK